MNFKVKFKEETPPFNVKFGWNNGEFEAGKAEEYDRFWGAYLSRVNGYNSMFTFAGTAWDDETFCPPYGAIINANGLAYYMFTSTRIKDLKGILQKRNVTLNFSKCTSCAYLFQNAATTHIGVVSTLNASDVRYAFERCLNLKSVDLLELKPDGSQLIDHMFRNCTALESVNISGAIGNNISFQQSTKLSKVSIISIINALSDSATGKTATFSKTAKESAFTAEEWAVLIGTKPNWTIALA